MTTIVLPDGSLQDVDAVTAHQMVFRGDARYAGEAPRRFGDLTGQLIGSAAQHPAAQATAPQPVPPSLDSRIAKLLSGRPRGPATNAGAGANTIRLLGFGSRGILAVGDDITIGEAHEFVENGRAEWLNPPPQVRAPGALMNAIETAEREAAATARASVKGAAA